MNKVLSYLQESKEELLKVTWPNKQEVIQYTILVVAISLGIAAFIGIVDFVLNLGVETLLTR